MIPGLVAGGAAVILSGVVMVRAEGGWSAFVEPFLRHSQRHFSRLVGNVGGFAELGLVKGLGGVLPATVLFLAATIGGIVWARRVGRRSAVLWTVVLAVAAAQLVWMQNRTYGRYAVGAQMALAPLVAGAVATLPPAAGCAGLLALTGWLGVGSWPLLEEQHSTLLPSWRAVLRAKERARSSGRTVVVESELHPFASYLWHLAEWRGEPTPPKVLSPWDPEPWAGVDGPWIVATVHRHLYPDGLHGFEEHWGGVSASLYPLTQQRFLDAWVIEEPALPLVGWWPRETFADGRPFMWGAPGAELALPPLPAGTELAIALRPAPGSEALNLALDGNVVATLDGRSEEQRVRIDLPPATTDRISNLAFDRSRGYPPGNDDPRPLAVQVFELRASSPGVGWAGGISHSWQRSALQVDIEGAHDPEVFPRSGVGMWLAPRAVLRLPAAAGRLHLRLWAPRPSPPRTVIRIAGRDASGPLDIGSNAEDHAVEILPGEAVDGRLEVEILSDPYVPSEHGGKDRRSLGVVISNLVFEPSETGS